MRSANIPPVYWGERLTEDGSGLRDLMTSGEFERLVSDGVGICFHGKPEPRYKLAMVFSKTVVAIGSSLLQVSLPELEASIRYETELLGQVKQVKQLMVTRFEKQTEFPYDRYMHSRLEEFFEQRYRDGDKVTHFEAHCQPKLSKWWSPDFTALINEKLIHVGV